MTYLSTTVLFAIAVIKTENSTTTIRSVNAMYVLHPVCVSQKPFTAEPSLELPCG